MRCEIFVFYAAPYVMATHIQEEIQAAEARFQELLQNEQVGVEKGAGGFSDPLFVQLGM